MKILFVGEGTYATSLAQTHKSYLEGFPQREKFLFDEMIKQGVEINKYSHASVRSEKFLKEEKKKFKEWLQDHWNLYDMIFINNPFSFSIIPNEWVRPVIFDYIDLYEKMYMTEFPGDQEGLSILQDSLAAVCERANRIIAQGGSTMKWMIEQGYAEKTTVIPNGYNEKLFYPYPKQKLEKVREKYFELYPHLKGKKIIAFTGKLGRWYSGLVDVARVVCDMEDWVFVLAGDGPLFDELKRFPKEKVTLLGRVKLEEVPDIQNLAHVCTLPVDDDSPIATTEYMACGRPVVHKGRLIDWLIVFGYHGDLVEHNCEYAEAIINSYRAITSPEAERRGYVQWNVDRVKNLTWSKLSKRFTEFVQSAVGEIKEVE